MLDLSNIKMFISNNDSFYIWVKTKEPSILQESLRLYCTDRKEDLIEGIVHELTEATITKIFLEFINLDDKTAFTFLMVKKEGVKYHVQHIATVLSLPYYSCQLYHKEAFESLLKERS